ncbi:MAG: dihydroneopterin aldolase [Epsilonproteobacteria bacterium]|nr:dihydroneopterin aldolase [Campylobacterota bacterium]
MQIYIKNLSFNAILGLLDFERKKPQKIIVDAKIKYNQKDGNFIDYAKVAELIKSTIITNKFLLIEDALKKLVSEIKDKFPPSCQIKLKISKPDILNDCIVGAKIKKNFKKN